ncbi:choline dehydrogenase [Nocardioides sp.]|uniref:choline dehydrogenase n=1 Tax=Nocardioides sp. TaxID=35761 RepID=UPI003D10EA4F
MAAEQYDYVIVGGGSAGSALANRLSTDPSTTVLVLEAGRSDYKLDPFINMPAALPIPIGNSLYDWKYETDPEPHMNGRRIYHARGKVLGGSSSINGMIFQRGNPMDYERWAGDKGLETWDYLHCLPYFKRMESCLAGADEWRGGSGPLKLERGPATNPLFSAFFEAAQQAGYPLTDDVNGYRQEGFARFDRNVYRGRRWSASRAYLDPVKSRKNLTIETYAFATRINFEGTRAVGVDYTRAGKLKRTVRAGEVILCGGAINSPQLLQLSGVGDEELLKQHGIPVVHHAPGVGENLQDHLEVYIQYASKQPVSIAPGLRYRQRPKIAFQWLFQRGGLGATNHFEGGGFARSNEDVDWPNLMFHFLPVAIRYDGTQPAGLKPGEHGYQVHIGPMYADTRGWVRIKSADPKVHPSMQFNYLSTPTDRKEWVEAIRVARDILNQPAFAPFNNGELSPGPGVESDEQILDWVREDAETALHPSCTAKMGLDDMSVTDPLTMKVHGTEGLRVVDASVFPYVTNGNIYAPVMMVAEKAADLIAGNTPLAPATVPYYRYRDGSPLYPPGDSRNREERA